MALLLATLTAPVPDTMAPFRGQPVLAVHVVAPPGNDPHELRALIDIEPGFILAAGDLQAAIKRLYALGRFSQVEVSASQEDGAVSLRFVVRPLRRLGQVEVVGSRALAASRLTEALGLAPGDEVDSHTVQRVQARGRALLVRRGFPAARLDVERRDELEAGTVLLRLVVREGPPRRLKGLRLLGQTHVAPAALRRMLRSQPGLPLDLDDLQHDHELLRRTLIERGYLQARVRPPQLRDTAEGALVDVVVDAGDRVDLRFRGNRALSDAALRALTPDPDGAVTGTNLRLLKQRIVQAYARLGYADARVGLRGVRGPGRGLTRYFFSIDEGRPAEVTRLRFVGLSALTEETFVEQLQALMRRELEAPPLFGRLAGAAAPDGRRGAAPPSIVPRARRWVPALYADAAAQAAATLRELGYLSAEVGPPQARAAALAAPPAAGDAGSPGPAEAGLCVGAPGHGPCPVEVMMPVVQGPQTFVDSMGFSGNTVLEAADLVQVVADGTADQPLTPPLLPGAPMSPTALEDGRIAIVRRYRDLGHLYVRVFTEVALDASGSWARLSFRIEEGPQVRVQRVLVRGNRFTREGVIRSRISLHQGDLYRLEQAVGDQRSIASLGVFGAVRVKLVDEEHPAERKDVVADVTERLRQPVEATLGVSTVNGPRLRLSYSHLNVAGTATAFTASLKLNRQVFFDLFGDFGPGLRARYASYRGIEQLTRAVEREVRVGLRSPPLRALPLDPLLRLDLVDQRVNAVRYSFDGETLIGGIDVLAARRLKGTLEAQVGLTNLECDVTLDPQCNQAVDVRRLQSRPIDVGTLWTLKGGPFVAWDWRDSPLNPRRGVFIQGRVTPAVGGAAARADNPFERLAFVKYEAGLTGYVPLWGAVLALAARAGTINILRSQVPINERFFLGGRDTVRGFVESTMVPEDACVGNGSKPPGCAELINFGRNVDGSQGPPLSRGGNTFLLGKLEVRLPVTPDVSFDLFLDAGNLWIDAFNAPLRLRLGTGFGLRYATPVGALAVDIGINPAPRQINAEPRLQLHFSIGSF